MPDRPAIPAYITREILIESGHRCAVCGAGCPLERAHIIPWHKSREHKAEDLICLCASCHERADLEDWGETTLREYKRNPWVLRQYKSEEVASTKSKIEITLAVELSDFEEREQRLFQYAIAAFLDVAPSNVRIISVEESNSIKVVIEVPSEGARKLVEAARKDEPELKAYLHPFDLLNIDRMSEIRKRILENATALKDIEPVTPQGDESAESGRRSEVIERAPQASMADSLGITVNPIRFLVKQLVRWSPATLLTAGITLSLIDFVALYTAAAKEGVLYVNQGIGLLNNYGLLSTIFGNAVLLYVAKKYYDSIRSIRFSNAVVNPAPIEKLLSTHTAMIEMRRRYKLQIYLLIMMGAMFWLSNVAFHIIGDPEIRWGYKVFDSIDHPLTFSASRLHNFYTWLIIMPFAAHVLIYSSVQLKQAIALAAHEGVLTYDLLNPDRRGGFVFADKAHLAFNTVAALIFIQITMNIDFTRGRSEKVIAYICIIIFLVGLHRVFLGGIYATIKDLKVEALNKVKDKVYKDDKLSFEILKYCYEQKSLTSLIVDFLIKAGPILIAGVIQLWPIIAKAFTGA